MAKAFYNNFLTDWTRIHTFEFNPNEFNIALTEGKLNIKERLTDIKHNWYESKGYTLACAVNAQFFGSYTMGLQFVDSGFMTNKNTLNDLFLELIYENKKLHIENIVHSDLLTKYPAATWAAGVGFALVINGKLNLLHSNNFSHAYSRNPRTAIGQKANGNIILVATDGRNTGSLGLTGVQLAQVMLDLGCVTAISLDGGGSSQMNCLMNGTYSIMNKLEDNYQRPITSAFMVYGKDVEVVDLTASEEPTKIGGRDFSVLISHFNKIYTTENALLTRDLNPIVGEIGNTGKSTGIHAHLGVVEGIQTELWRLADMANGNPKPSKQQTEYFLDSSLFNYEIFITETWLGYKNHYAYDVVPENRKRTSANYNLLWKRSFPGRVTKIGYDPAYGNYIIIWYNIL